MRHGDMLVLLSDRFIVLVSFLFSNIIQKPNRLLCILTDGVDVLSLRHVAETDSTCLTR